MMNRIHSILLVVSLSLSLSHSPSSCSPSSSYSEVSAPSLESLSIEWQNQPLRAMPVVQNFYGAATLRRDASPGFGSISLSPLTSAPFNGNFQNSTFFVDGRPTKLNQVKWSLCEGTRWAHVQPTTTLHHNNDDNTNSNSNSNNNNNNYAIVNRVRMPFEQHGFMQIWDIQPNNNDSITKQRSTMSSSSSSISLSLLLDGPFYRRCDYPKAVHGADNSCGWGLQLPVDRKNFSLDLQQSFGDANVMVMVIEDTKTPAAAASAIWVDSCATATQSATVESGSAACEQFVISIDSTLSAFTAKLSIDASSLVLKQAVAVADNKNDALMQLKSYLDSFDKVFDEACTLAEQRWQSAFTSSASSSSSSSSSLSSPSYFSGSLPTISSNYPLVDHLYYWSELALLSLQRSNLLTYPVSFVISEGPSNSFVGDGDMGGTGQYVWDQSFSALSYALVDPSFTHHFLVYVIQYSLLDSSPFQIPENWDAYMQVEPDVGDYCFDFVSAFFFIQQFVSYTNNATNFLFTPISSIATPNVTITPLAYLRMLAWSWLGYPASAQTPFLRDYGSDKRSFLEAVPTYTNVIAALQINAAGMMLSLANLLEQLQQEKLLVDDDVFDAEADSSTTAGRQRRFFSVYFPQSELHGAGVAWHTIHDRDVSSIKSLLIQTEIDELRGNATAVLEAVFHYQYIEGNGFFQCLYNQTSSTAVRALSDFIYTGVSLGSMSGHSNTSVSRLLTSSSRREMVAYFMNELLANGWVRALSLSDPVMSGVYSLQPTVEQKLAMRTDWTGTGGYGGLAGYACDAVAELDVEDLGFGRVLSVLSNLSLVASSSMPAQGVAVMSPPYMIQWLDNNDGLPAPTTPFAPNFPEFFDEPNYPPVWPSTSRSIQNAEASIGDCIIRSLFGWRPSWLSFINVDKKNVSEVIDASLWHQHTARGDFVGTLYGVNTPAGYIDITANQQGLSWKWHQ